jgi:hypothetical protein
MAVRKWEQLNPDKLRYEVIFTNQSVVPTDALTDVCRFVEETEP